jgi:hypothetical protein
MGPGTKPLPALPAVSATATACPGRGRDGRVPYLGRQPGPELVEPTTYDAAAKTFS